MKISSTKDLEKIAKKIRKILLPGDVVFLYGEIGVGKTTFTRFLVNSYEKENNLSKSEVLSPTFNILFEYDIGELNIKHYDLYRLNKNQEIQNIGLFEDLKNTIVLIEWPEIIKKKPKNRLDLFFKYTKNIQSRILKIKTNGRLNKHDFK